MHEACVLVLSDGAEFRGRSFGAAAPLVMSLKPNTVPKKGTGEVVFNTGMCGYHEILTDPSYSGQIVAMTYPMIGNYGADNAWNEVGPEANKPKVKAAGFAVRSCYDGPLPDGRITLDSFLVQHQTPGIYDLDTRALTLHIRERGSINGVIVAPEEGRGLNKKESEQCSAFLETFPSMQGRDLLPDVGTDQLVSINAQGTPLFALIDCGIKANIIEELRRRGCGVLLFPAGTSASEVLDHAPDAVLYSNGPGDPAVLDGIISQIGSFLGSIPVFGICLGHQLICQAIGAETRKMKFGHHGVNHPVRDERSRKVFVTSQNHGFDVIEASLGTDTEVWFRNANDKTVEGIRDDQRRLLTAQFHPEAAPGPRDSGWIFDEFVRVAGGKQ